MKLACDEGEIDFIVAPDLTDRPHAERDVGGRRITVDTPAEIVIKKAFYRAVELRIRDRFDLAVVIDRQRDALERNAPLLRSKRALLVACVDNLIPRYRARAAGEIAVLPAGEVYLARAPDLVRGFLGSL